MTTAQHTPERQWPDNICAGDIYYGRAANYDGFYLADVDHGIPTFGSVTETANPTIRGQHVRVFNYPGQTEQIAAELVRRWNAHADLLAALEECSKQLTAVIDDGIQTDWRMWRDDIDAIIAKAKTGGAG